jgi:hypothetical protein
MSDFISFNLEGISNEFIRAYMIEILNENNKTELLGENSDIHSKNIDISTSVVINIEHITNIFKIDINKSNNIFCEVDNTKITRVSFFKSNLA